MRPSLRIVMLLTDGFGGVGGIAKFNRDFLVALASCRDVERVHALPRLIPATITVRLPETVVYDRKAANGKVAFMLRLLTLAWNGGPVDVVICAHLYLLGPSWFL